MGFNIHENTWEECLRNIHTCSVNARHNLIQFKVIHRFHYSKSKFHKIYPTVSPLCNKCKTVDGTLFHSLWSCSKIQPFWKGIFKFLSEAHSINLEPEPSIGILGANSAFCNRYQTIHYVLYDVSKKTYSTDVESRHCPNHWTMDQRTGQYVAFGKNGILIKWETTHF